jgi:pimeloyl-ACP methyl ester carboxylesterase
MAETHSGKSARDSGGATGPADMFRALYDYSMDMAQRSVLFWDVMRQRGNAYYERLEQQAPHVLNFAAELVIDGRKLERPVNYALVRVKPPRGTEIDDTRRPFVVVDPRAGHGPGIGGFKADSEIGVAFKAGHPCYFVGFLPDPMPGQTIEDILRAEAIFLRKVMELHPDADGKPCIIGNCQAGWAVMMLAAVYPELCGPLIIAGSPLSYWAGVRGKNPMRYSGGLLGGSWLAALTSDLGNGKFDGAWLVQNFENLNPSNTLWTKQYNLYSKIDTEAPRYLDFERWWGGHVNLNAEEIQFIVDQLFVGNNLAAGYIKLSDGASIDLRAIRTPIVVFCSKGDNITPPQQALDWILNLYEDVGEIQRYGQTIVYTIHEKIGHLGIFVSAGVARKEHGELSSNIDLIDTLPPGLYEAIFEEKTPETVGGELIVSEWVMRCEARTLDDIRAHGYNSLDDDRRFATAARVSEINLTTYKNFVQPFVRALVNEPTAEWLRSLHPLALQYSVLSDKSPFARSLKPAAEHAQKNRRKPAPDNPFIKMQEQISNFTVTALDAWRDMRDAYAESLFLTIYGSPLLQAAVGIDRASDRQPRKAGKSRLHGLFVERRIAELKAQMAVGGLREAIIRALIYLGMSRNSVDERGFEMIRRIRAAADETIRLPLDAFKTLVRDQYFMLLIDTEAALEAIPALLPPDREERKEALALVKRVCSARGEIVGEELRRLERITRLFGLEQARAPVAKEPAVTTRIMPAPPPKAPVATPLKVPRAPERKSTPAAVETKDRGNGSPGARGARNRSEPR